MRALSFPGLASDRPIPEESPMQLPIDLSAVPSPEDRRMLQDLVEALREWRLKIRMMVRGTRIGTTTIRFFGDLEDIPGAGPPGCVPPLSRLSPARRTLVEMTRAIARGNWETAWREEHPEDLSRYATDVSGNPQPQWQATAPPRWPGDEPETAESDGDPYDNPPDDDPPLDIAGWVARQAEQWEQIQATTEMLRTLPLPLDPAFGKFEIPELGYDPNYSMPPLRFDNIGGPTREQILAAAALPPFSLDRAASGITTVTSEESFWRPLPSVDASVSWGALSNQAGPTAAQLFSGQVSGPVAVLSGSTVNGVWNAATTGAGFQFSDASRSDIQTFASALGGSAPQLMIDENTGGITGYSYSPKDTQTLAAALYRAFGNTAPTIGLISLTDNPSAAGSFLNWNFTNGSGTNFLPPTDQQLVANTQFLAGHGYDVTQLWADAGLNYATAAAPLAIPTNPIADAASPLGAAAVRMINGAMADGANIAGWAGALAPPAFQDQQAANALFSGLSLGLLAAPVIGEGLSALRPLGTATFDAFNAVLADTSGTVSVKFATFGLLDDATVAKVIDGAPNGVTYAEPFGPPAPTATQLRNSPGVVTVSGELQSASSQWLAADTPTPIPSQVGDALVGKSFDTFGDLRGAIWQEISDNEELSSSFGAVNQGLMAEGYAPFAPQAFQIGDYTAGQVYGLHHIEFIENGGSVYDLSNLQIVSPKVHYDIHYPPSE